MEIIKCKKCGAENTHLTADIRKLSFASYDVEKDTVSEVVEIETALDLACPLCGRFMKTLVRESP